MGTLIKNNQDIADVHVENVGNYRLLLHMDRWFTYEVEAEYWLRLGETTYPIYIDRVTSGNGKSRIEVAYTL